MGGVWRARVACVGRRGGETLENSLGYRVFALVPFSAHAILRSMLETLHIPDDLEACQQLVRELMQAYSQLERVNQELLEMCANIEDSQQKLKQERDELQLTIKRLMHQLYGRRSERWKEGEGQKHLDFGDLFDAPFINFGAKAPMPMFSEEELNSFIKICSSLEKELFAEA